MKKTRKWIFLSAAIGALSLLPIEASHAQEGFELGLTLDSTTVDPQSGQVTISGTATCSTPTTGSGYASVSQPVGRDRGVEGIGYVNFYCDQDGEPYSFSFFANEGRFASGKAVVTLEVYACDWYSCDSARIQQSVRLKPAK